MTAKIKYKTTLVDYEAVATNFQIVELISGDIIVTPPPTIKHQLILGELHLILKRELINDAFVFLSPIGVKTGENEIFEPDIVIVENSNQKIIHSNYIEGAPDLVVEILSPSTAHRDYNIKMHKYGELGIREYWIIDPEMYSVEIYENIDGKMEKKDTFNFPQDEIKSKIFDNLRFILKVTLPNKE